MAIATTVRKALKAGGFHADYIGKDRKPNPKGIRVVSNRDASKAVIATEAIVSHQGSEVDPGKVIGFLQGLGYNVRSDDGKVIVSGEATSASKVDPTAWVAPLETRKPKA